MKPAKWIFFSALAPFRGGIAQFSELLLAALSRKKQLESFTFRKQYPNFLFPGSSQIDAAAHDTHRRIVSTFRPWTYFSAAWRLRRENAAVFVTSYWMSFFSPMMCIWAKLLGKSTLKIAIVHNLKPHESRFFDLLFNRWFVLNYDAFVVLSAAVAADIRAIRPTANVLQLSHPPYAQFGPLQERQSAQLELGLDPQKKTLLFFGLIRSYKGLLPLLEAFRFLDTRFQLLVVGEFYEETAPYEAAFAALDASRVLRVHRYVNDSEIPRYFAATDLVLLPYISATQSGIRAIAQAYQRPVLCSAVGGLSEGLEESQEGFVATDLTPNALAEQIASLFESGRLDAVNNTLRARYAKPEQAWDQFADAFIAFTESLPSKKD